MPDQVRLNRQDVMATIVCLMPGNKFYNSSYKWAQAWKKAFDTPIGTRLLRGLYIEERGGYSFCDQDYLLQQRLLNLGISSSYSPDFEVQLISDPARNEFLGRQQALLALHHADLRFIANILAEELTLPS